MSKREEQKEKRSEVTEVSQLGIVEPSGLGSSSKVGDVEGHSSSNDPSAEKSFELIDLGSECQEKISGPRSPKSLGASSNPNKSLPESIKPLESQEQDNKFDQLAGDIEHIWYQKGIGKMVGCFKVLLDKRLRKVITVRRIKTDGAETKIASEIIPLFNKLSRGYLNGEVELGLSPNKAWVRGLNYKTDIDPDALEEIKTQALTQGIYLRPVRQGYLKAVYTKVY